MKDVAMLTYSSGELQRKLGEVQDKALTQPVLITRHGRERLVVLHAARFPELLEALGTEHLAERVGRIHRAVDEDVRDVDALRRELRIERLAQHAPPAHRRRVGVLAAVAANRASSWSS